MIYELGIFLKNLLLPPVGFGWLLAIALWQFTRRPRLARLLIALVTLGGTCLATPFVSEMLLRTVSVQSDPSRYLDAQAIVILGAEASLQWDKAGERVVDANPGRFTLLRLHFGARLAKQTGLPILVSGGNFDARGPALAEVMRRALEEDFGTPVRWVENMSRNTMENAEFSARILLQQNIRTAILVTSGFHLRRAIVLFEKAGLEVLPSPVPPTSPQVPIGWRDFLPDAPSLMTSYYAFHELGGLVYSVLR